MEASALHYPLVNDPRSPPGPLRVIITADDFGLAPAVNEAVEQAHRDGVLTSASLMVAEPAATDAVAIAKRMPTLRVGLHVVVADGRSVLAANRIRAIVDESGRLPDHLVAAGFRFFFLPHARRALHAEVRAQFEAFRAFGLPLDHVDTHRHLILHPTVLGIILALSSEFQVQAIRLPVEPWRATRGLPLGTRLTAAVRRVGLAPWLALVRWRLQRAGIRHNAEVRGLTDTGNMNEAAALRLVGTLDRDLTEIFFHPATASAPAGTLPQSTVRHVAEFEALCSPRVRAALDRAGVVRVGYGDLSGHSPPSAR
jgi:hopanoid biosynthesis associated protein HpnK